LFQVSALLITVLLASRLAPFNTTLEPLMFPFNVNVPPFRRFVPAPVRALSTS
jgi:hypothetical protein